MTDTNNNQLSADRSIIALGAKGIQLTNFEELFRFSTFVHKAGFAPRGIDTAEKVFLAVQMGLEVGISPMMALQNAAVINGRPGFYGELVVAIIQAHPSYEDMIIEYSGEGEDYGCSVTIKRRGRTPRVGTFTVREAKEADLLNNPSKKDTWGKYKKDMLYWRAFARAKGIFSDVLRGFRTVEDLQDMPEERQASARVVEPNLPKPNARLEPPPDAVAREKALERLAEIKRAVEPPTQNGEPLETPFAEVTRRLSEADIPQQDFLRLMDQLAFIEADNDSIEQGHFVIGHIPEKTLKLILSDWDKVMAQLVVSVGKGAVPA